MLFRACGHYTFVLWFLLLSFFFFPRLISSAVRLDVYHASTHDVALVRIYTPCTRYNRLSNLLLNRNDNRFDNRLYRVNGALECMSEIWCTRLAEKKDAKNHQLDTIAHLCPALSSQLRHISTIGKNLLNSTPEICWRVWGTPANFNLFGVFASLLVHYSYYVLYGRPM